jgi:hypothetical protein
VEQYTQPAAEFPFKNKLLLNLKSPANPRSISSTDFPVFIKSSDYIDTRPKASAIASQTRPSINAEKRSIMEESHIEKSLEESQGPSASADHERFLQEATSTDKRTLTTNLSTQVSLTCPYASLRSQTSPRQTPRTMPAPEKEVPRFEAFPPEVRNEIYRYLLSTQACKVIRSRHYSSGCSYHFHTAILRTSSIISQEAHGVLYKDNLLILLQFGKVNVGYHPRAFHSGVAFRYTSKVAQLPVSPIRIQQRENYKGNLNNHNFNLVVAATDFPTVCENLSMKPVWPYAGPSWQSFSVTALPRTGWAVEQLRDLIWLPLKALQTVGIPGSKDRIYHQFKAIDCTGVLEDIDEMFDWASESE